MGWIRLGFSFFAGALGAWTVYSVPQVGADVGPWGIIMYAVALFLPYVILPWLAPPRAQAGAGGLHGSRLRQEALRHRHVLLRSPRVPFLPVHLHGGRVHVRRWGHLRAH